MHEERPLFDHTEILGVRQLNLVGDKRFVLKWRLDGDCPLLEEASWIVLGLCSCARPVQESENSGADNLPFWRTECDSRIDIGGKAVWCLDWQSE